MLAACEELSPQEKSGVRAEWHHDHPPRQASLPLPYECFRWEWTQRTLAGNLTLIWLELSTVSRVLYPYIIDVSISQAFV
jgi:hypothetical protein